MRACAPSRQFTAICAEYGCNTSVGINLKLFTRWVDDPIGSAFCSHFDLLDTLGDALRAPPVAIDQLIDLRKSSPMLSQTARFGQSASVSSLSGTGTRTSRNFDEHTMLSVSQDLCFRGSSGSLINKKSPVWRDAKIELSGITAG
mmetsp:Transcript_179564/g.569461  ORF Transcript_179564/g.569461 Transcript_179564/m.569461 type:complete len:145 (-) Transcript_179564:137-571(-)